jgi:hypothetical protein
MSRSGRSIDIKTMDKRYQIFVSSTFADLKEERQRVMQAIMEMDCIPAGMELFPAADDEQWEFIKKIIDDCDYYILILGNRYGSLSSEGISFTEKEFDYAISKGLKVLAFVHEDPDTLAVSKSDIDPSLRSKLGIFRARVCGDRIVKFWRAASELPGLVALSLAKTIKAYPAVGWARASAVGNPELLADLNSLRKENDSLRERVALLEASARPAVSNMATLDEEVTIRVRWTEQGKYGARDREHKITMAWASLFAAIAPIIQEHPADVTVMTQLARMLYRISTGTDRNVSIVQDDFLTIRVQFEALGLIDATYSKTVSGGAAFFWNLTERGQKLMLELRAVKSALKS